MKKFTYLLLCLLLGIGLATAQNVSVRGVVISADDGEPVIGASVVVKGTTTGTVTNLDGEFTLNVPSSAQTLVISYIGMKAQEVAVAPNIRVILESSTQNLDEVVVVAYGVVKKESFTGSASLIQNEKIEKRLVTSVSKALEGQATGVTTTSGGGQPGEDAKLTIRGFGSINASTDPLYVVDGVPFDGKLNSLNSSDIESITVLKDASAGALYGARGANGVVIITTKRGKEGKTNVNYKGSVGWSKRGIKRYDMVDQKEFTQLTYESLRNSYVFNNNYSWENASTAASKDMSSALGGELYNPFKNYTWETIIDPATGLVRPDAVSAWDENWMDAVSRTGLRHEHALSISGGTDKTQAMFSLGYLDEEGVMLSSGFQRYTGRVSVDTEVNEWIKGGLSASFAYTDQKYQQYTGTTTTNVWYTAQFMAPIYPVYEKNLDGTDKLDENGNRLIDYGPERVKAGNFSSLGTLNDDLSRRRDDNISARTYFTIGSDSEKAGWAQGLKLQVNFGADLNSRNQMLYYNMHHGNQATSNGLIYKDNIRTFSYTMNQLLTWNRKFDDHTFDILLGHEYYDREYNFLRAAKSNLVEGIYELRPGTDLRAADSYTHKYRIESVLSRFNYNYQEKYYLSGSWRTDGSSRFHKDNRWGNFWSVGGNWRISQEEFMESVEWMDNLSLRASYGMQGNDGLLDSSNSAIYYAWQGLYDLGYPNAGNVGAFSYSLENPYVSWEKNANLNIGFDTRLFNGRLDLSMEYYNKKTTDLLLEYPKAMSSGYTGYNANVGSMRNSGFEFSLSGSVLKVRDFEWRATLLGTTSKNKVLKLTAQTPEIINGVFSIKEGNPLNTYYMAKSAGVDPATGAQLYWAYDIDGNGNKIGEDFITDDYSLASSRKYYQGSRIPDIYGSFGSDFTYKGFDLSILLTYSIGGKVYDSLYRSAMDVTYSGDVWNKHALRRWQKPGDITDVPRAEIGGSTTTNDRFLINASYLAFKNITIGYTLPKSILRKAGMQNLRLFCTLDNLALFSHLDGMDPQYNFKGETAYSYSPNRVCSFGIDINF